jgi:NAD+ kinase
MEAFVVSPMCAHSMSNRPLVLRPEQTLALRVGGGSKKPGLSVDGQVLVDLNEGAVITVRRGKVPVRLALPDDRSFWDALRTRLHWAGQPPYEGDGA